MHGFSITTILTIAFATLASAAPLVTRDTAYKAPTGTGTFNLQVIAIRGNLSYSGMFLEPYHTGAGLNVLTAFDDQKTVQRYNFTSKTGDVSAYLGAYPYYLSVDGVTEGFLAPKGYSYFGFNVGGPDKSNLTFTTPDNYLHLPSNEDYVMSICPSEIYTPGVYVPTLVYRKPAAKRNATCADVMVKAIF